MFRAFTARLQDHRYSFMRFLWGHMGARHILSEMMLCTGDDMLCNTGVDDK